MGRGLQTVTAEMTRAYQDACVDPLRQPFFWLNSGIVGREIGSLESALDGDG